ncbi:MAG: M15 family metallopeptidase [Luminiphilus sp.]
MPQSLIAFGLSEEHLVSIAPDLRAERETATAFQTLGRRAAERGFEFRIASAFRDYDRQVRIINDKWTGARPVTDGDGRLLERAQYDDQEWLNLILRFSALPGTSRHHWGTDLDIWDASTVDEDYRLQLVPSEYGPSGPFFEMTRWLDELMAADDAEGFYKPYAEDRGGIAPEQWHISYRPAAMKYQERVAPELLMPLWRGEADACGNVHEPLAMLEVIEPRVDDLMERFVAVSES